MGRYFCYESRGGVCKGYRERIYICVCMSSCVPVKVLQFAETSRRGRGAIWSDHLSGLCVFVQYFTQVCIIQHDIQVGVSHAKPL